MSNIFPPMLVTGAGGAAAVSFLKEIEPVASELHVADVDPCAAGLYFVSEAERHLIPRGDAPEFVDHLLALCRRLGIQVLVPTVDAELLPIARREPEFRRLGVRVLAAGAEVLEVVLDKARLIETARRTVPCPMSVVYKEGLDLSSWEWPLIAKPRTGSGSSGVRQLDSPADLENLPGDGSILVQELLPGEEYSVDVLADASGFPMVAVPRVRMKVDSGIAVCAATVRDSQLERLSFDLVADLRLPFVSNVQWRRDSEGAPRLLEINPRLPGTMPLTVASGVNMPRLAVGLLMGWSENVPSDFAPTAVVRSLAETLVPAAELETMVQRSRLTADCFQGAR